MQQDGHKRELTATGVLDAMCELLSRFAVKGKLPKEYNENRWGIDVRYHKEQVGLVMLAFVTEDDLYIELPFEFSRLNKEGRDYLDGRMEILLSQLEAARAERQRDESIIVLPEQAPTKKERSIIAETVSQNVGRVLH